MTKKYTKSCHSYFKKLPTMSTRSSIRSSISTMEEDYKYGTESIRIRSITTRKKELKVAELELFNRYPGNFRRFKRQYRLYLCTNKESLPRKQGENYVCSLV